MTYILGARCTDGVVLVGDQKISGGDAPYYEEKLIEIMPSAVVGGAGTAGLIDRFSDKLELQISNQEITNHDELIESVEERSFELVKKYEHRVGDFDIIMGVRKHDRSELYNIVTRDGFAEPIKKHIAIGSGESHGALLLKALWHENMSMLDFAKLGYFLIEYVAHFELDDSVGGDITVWFIPDILEKTKNEKKVKKLQQKYKARLANKNEIVTMKKYSDKKAFDGKVVF